MSQDIDQLCIDTIRTLSMDAVQKANSRAPGPAAWAWRPPPTCSTRGSWSTTRATRSGPTATASCCRPATARCCSTASLHLSGYDLPLDELKRFRQWGSLTPGHPERDRVHVTPGVEVTTGPLGQGFANGVGMAMAESFLREHYGARGPGPPHLRDRLRRRPHGGHRRRGRLAGRPPRPRAASSTSTTTTTSRSTARPTLSFAAEDVAKRFEAYGWHVQAVDDANDLDALERRDRQRA